MLLCLVAPPTRLCCRWRKRNGDKRKINWPAKSPVISCDNVNHCTPRHQRSNANAGKWRKGNLRSIPRQKNQSCAVTVPVTSQFPVSSANSTVSQPSLRLLGGWIHRGLQGLTGPSGTTTGLCCKTGAALQDSTKDTWDQWSPVHTRFFAHVSSHFFALCIQG